MEAIVVVGLIVLFFYWLDEKAKERNRMADQDRAWQNDPTQYKAVQKYDGKSVTTKRVNRDGKELD